jgi:hypothetical protein
MSLDDQLVDIGRVDGVESLQTEVIHLLRTRDKWTILR